MVLPEGHQAPLTTCSQGQPVAPPAVCYHVSRLPPAEFRETARRVWEGERGTESGMEGARKEERKRRKEGGRREEGGRVPEQRGTNSLRGTDSSLR